MRAGVMARTGIGQWPTFGWERYVAEAGRVIALKTIGASEG